MRSYYDNILYCLERRPMTLYQCINLMIVIKKKVIEKALSSVMLHEQSFFYWKVTILLEICSSICFRNFGNTFDENWMMKKLDEKICSH
jgi:hypothetical protein